MILQCWQVCKLSDDFSGFVDKCGTGKRNHTGRLYWETGELVDCDCFSLTGSLVFRHVPNTYFQIFMYRRVCKYLSTYFHLADTRNFIYLFQISNIKVNFKISYCQDLENPLKMVYTLQLWPFFTKKKKKKKKKKAHKPPTHTHTHTTRNRQIHEQYNMCDRRQDFSTLSKLIFPITFCRSQCKRH